MDIKDILLVFLTATFLKTLFRILFRTQGSVLVPPGPPKRFLFGNLFDMPTGQEWVTFAKWGEKWGDLIYVTIPFQPGILVLSSLKRATELLDKQSAIYSDRPMVYMGGELVGWKRVLGFQRYNGKEVDHQDGCEENGGSGSNHFRSFRKLAHHAIGTNSSLKKFHPVMEMQVRNFLKQVLDDPSPEMLKPHIRQSALAVILRIVYGYHLKESNDDFLTIADAVMQQFSLSTSPGGFAVNFFPFSDPSTVRHVPAWLPGGGFKKIAQAWAKNFEEMVNRPFSGVKNALAAGKAEVSMVSELLRKDGLLPEQEYDTKWAATSLYTGASDTTVASVHALFLAMALHPKVMKKAQEEIDSVVGTERLPTLEDWQSLPYVSALTLELLRWHVVVPLALPHRVVEDNICSGYLIPEGTIVLPNLWKMAHNPEIYSDPFTFRPERFLGPSPEQDPRAFCWGFGRRICPGRLLAETSIFIACAMTLAVFDISKYSNNGIVEEPELGQTNGTISHPNAFKCTIIPRSKKAAEMIVAQDLQ